MNRTDPILTVVKEAIADLMSQMVGNTPYFTTFTIYPIPQKIGKRHLAARISLQLNGGYQNVFDYRIIIIKDSNNKYKIKTVAFGLEDITRFNFRNFSQLYTIAHEQDPMVFQKKVTDTLRESTKSDIFWDFMFKVKLLTTRGIPQLPECMNNIDEFVTIKQKDGSTKIINKTFSELFEIALAAVFETDKLLQGAPFLKTEISLMILPHSDNLPNLSFFLSVFHHGIEDHIYIYEVAIEANETGNVFVRGHDLTEREGEERQMFEEIEVANEKLKKIMTVFDLQQLTPKTIMLDCLSKMKDGEQWYSEN